MILLPPVPVQRVPHSLLGLVDSKDGGEESHFPSPTRPHMSSLVPMLGQQRAFCGRKSHCWRMLGKWLFHSMHADQLQPSVAIPRHCHLVYPYRWWGNKLPRHNAKQWELRHTKWHKESLGDRHRPCHPKLLLCPRSWWRSSNQERPRTNNLAKRH